MLAPLLKSALALEIAFEIEQGSPEPFDEIVDLRLRDDALEFPTLARHLPAMANRSFIVRRQNGTQAPTDSGFKAYVETVLAGMEQTLSHAR